MLQAVAKGWFSRGFRIEEEGTPVAELAVGVGGASVEVEGTVYRMRREGLLHGAFLLEADGREAARAEKPSLFRACFTVRFPRGECVLRKDSLLGLGFGVHSGNERVGEIRRSGLLARRAEIDLPADWPLAARLFLFWLAQIVWKREAAAASS